MRMFEWDENKRLLNYEKHGILFDDVCRIFDGFVLKRPDDRFDYGESRSIGIGDMDGLVVVVVFTEREGGIRLISARPANRDERAVYHDFKNSFED